MSVSPSDVRHVAALARLEIPEERVAAVAAELTSILRHMEVLSRVDTSGVDPVHGVGTGGMPLRADDGPQYPVARANDAFAPALRDGYFVVPRLASHATSPDAPHDDGMAAGEGAA